VSQSCCCSDRLLHVQTYVDLGEMDVSLVLYISLKRQEPIRLSQLQSPSPLRADINIKRPHHHPETTERIVAFLRFSLAPPCFFRFYVPFWAQRNSSFPGDTTCAYRILSSRQSTSSEVLPSHLVDIVFSVDVPPAHKVAPPFQGCAQLDAADIRMSPPRTTLGFLLRQQLESPACAPSSIA
jgi:hypothetical protein